MTASMNRGPWSGWLVLAACVGVGTGCAQQASNNGIITPPPSPVQSVAFAPDGKLVAAGVASTLKLWDPATGNERAAWPAGMSQITCLAFAPDGQRLAAGQFDGTLRVWE